jgi:uncharacterized protein (DUF2141 family)
MVKIDSRPLRLTTARPSQTFFNIKTSKSTASFTVTSTEFPIYASHGEDTENIRIYNTMKLQADDSIPVLLHAHDSLSQSIDTTLYIKFSQRELKPTPFQLTPDAFSVSANSGQLHGKITFNKPVLHINHDSLFYRIDTAQIVPIVPEDIQFDTTRTTLTITKQINKTLLQPRTGSQNNAARTRTQTSLPRPNSAGQSPKKLPSPYEFNIAYATFISAEGDSSKATTLPIKPSTMETTGVIILTINTKQRPLLVELIYKNKVIKTESATNKITFHDLEPGEYSVRVIVDTDGNYRWSPGNIFRNEPPEPIHFYRSEDNKLNISLKANWERELLITF